MDKFRSYIAVLSIYLVGINLYFCLWYLGSEGVAVLWNYGDITFSHIWVSGNIASIFGFAGLVKLRVSTRRWFVLKVSGLGIGFLLHVITTFLFFLGAFLLISNILLGFHSFKTFLGYARTTVFLSLAIYHFTLTFVIVALLNLKQSFGGLDKVFGYSFKRVFKPREVEHGFMFLDLNNSTGIAEKLNSEVYSAFLRDCFHLLEEIVETTNGIEVYQYVGDEAILYWDFKDKKMCLKALETFQRFKQGLFDMNHYFQVHYKTIPSFKGAIHGGLVTKSELGSKMIHTAFHGDVLNATSRILGLCHKHQTDLLISAQYLQSLMIKGESQKYERISDVALSGKDNSLTVYKPVTKDSPDKPTNNNEFYLTKND